MDDWQPGRPEYEWAASDNPDVLLRLAAPLPEGYWSYGLAAGQSRLTPTAFRRLQLFGCACARAVWELLPTDARSAVEVRERFADGRATAADLRAAAMRLPAGERTAAQHAAACAARAGGYHLGGGGTADWEPADAARSAAKALACRAAGPAPAADGSGRHRWHAAWNRAFAAARAHQAELVRDVFPPPGYAPAFRPEWRTDTAVALARQMDDTGEYSAAPILADALMDAGCTDEVLLARCRAPAGVRCRGNWAVDLVLGRA